MKTQNTLFILLLILTFVISACSGTLTSSTDKPGDTMMESAQPTQEVMMGEAMPTQDTMMDEAIPTHDTMMDDTMSTPDATTGSSGDTMMDTPAWFSTSLTNVNTGEAFTINDLKGKVVLVETMAVWCSNCYQQQTQVKILHEKLGMRDDFVSLGMDIDPNEDSAKLQAFVEKNSFDWMYAVSPADVSREISSLYGAQFLNPPSTPMLIIDRHGEAHPLPFSIKSSDDLLAALQPYLDEAM